YLVLRIRALPGSTLFPYTTLFRSSDSAGRLLSFLHTHGDHEPTLSPSREGNGQDADECLLPSWEGSGGGSIHAAATIRSSDEAVDRKSTTSELQSRFDIVCRLLLE